jgi:hypothetical protein
MALNLDYNKLWYSTGTDTCATTTVWQEALTTKREYIKRYVNWASSSQTSCTSCNAPSTTQSGWYINNTISTSTQTVVFKWHVREMLGDWVANDRQVARVQQPRPQLRLQDILEARRAPQIIIPTGRKALAPATQQTEEYARQLLRAIIGEERYFLFLKNGFVSLRGASGKIYQIYPGHGITRVWKDGVQIERLCVVYSADNAGNSLPPTDSLIMRYLQLSNDEDAFRRTAVIHSVAQDRLRVIPVDDRPLSVILQEHKVRPRLFRDITAA